MKTIDTLYDRHKAKLLNVEDENVCKEYFGLSPATARRYARADKLGVPAFQIRKANGAPWFIDIEDLARVLDRRTMKVGR